MIDSLIKETQQKMRKTIEVTCGEFAAIHTGRASKALVEGLRVDYYGTLTPLKQLANISIPESRLILIQPWDPSAFEVIEKAILKSDLGFTPTNDGKLIRINVPQLTQERREDLTKILKNIAEEGKVTIRSERRDANEKAKKAKASSKISEDDEFRFHKEIQDLTDKHIKEIDDILEKKQKEIKEI